MNRHQLALLNIRDIGSFNLIIIDSKYENTIKSKALFPSNMINHKIMYTSKTPVKSILPYKINHNNHVPNIHKSNVDPHTTTKIRKESRNMQEKEPNSGLLPKAISSLANIKTMEELLAKG